MDRLLAEEIERYLGGSLSDAELETFLVRLRNDPDSRIHLGRLLIQQSLLVDCLRLRAANDGSADMERFSRPDLDLPASASRPQRWRSSRWLTARPRASRILWAAALVITIGLFATGLRQALRAEPFATVTRSAAAAFSVARGGNEVASPQELNLGEVLTVSSGRLLVTFSGEPTTLDIEAPGSLSIVDQGKGRRITITRGTITAEVAPQLHGALLLATPTARITVLGTRLTVVAGSDETYVSVAHGAIEVAHEDGVATRVAADQYAMVRAGTEVVARAQVPGAELNRGLIGYWPMDEGSGEVVHDASGHGSDGRLMNASWSAGRFGAALAFNGQFGGDKVDLGPHSLRPILGLTVSAWVKTSSLRFGTVFGSSFTIGAGASTLGIPESVLPGADAHAGYVNFLEAGNAQKSLDSRHRINDGTWHHVAWRFSAADGERAIFIDGLVDARERDSIQHERSWDGQWVIGAASDRLVWNFEGLIDEVRLYDRPLGDGEIRRLSGN